MKTCEVAISCTIPPMMEVHMTEYAIELVNRRKQKDQMEIEQSKKEKVIDLIMVNDISGLSKANTN